MRIILQFIITVTFLYAHEIEYKAKVVTSKELEDIKKIDYTLYKLAIKKKSYNISKVTNFIIKHLAYKQDYLNLTLTAQARAEDNLKASLILEYIFYSPKEKKEKEREKIKIIQEITNKVKEYYNLKAKLFSLKVDLRFYKELEKRYKARKLAGVDSFEKWLEIIKKIKETNKNIIETEINLDKAKLILLSYVNKENKDFLKRMLNDLEISCCNCNRNNTSF